MSTPSPIAGHEPVLFELGHHVAGRHVAGTSGRDATGAGPEARVAVAGACAGDSRGDEACVDGSTPFSGVTTGAGGKGFVSGTETVDAAGGAGTGAST